MTALVKGSVTLGAWVLPRKTHVIKYAKGGYTVELYGKSLNRYFYELGLIFTFKTFKLLPAVL